MYQELKEDALCAKIAQTNQPAKTLSGKQIEAMIRAIKMTCFTDAQPFEWIEQPEGAPAATDLIPFQNGLLDFAIKKLWPYDGRYFATGRPKVNYDPKAQCVRWERALVEWFEGSSEDRVDMVPTLQEFFGYALTPDISNHAILALLGAGRAGKSTIINVLEQLCGRAHFKTRGLGDLAGPHGLQGLEDARIIYIPDAADTNLQNRAQALGRLKNISGGDPVSINPKNKTPFDARIPAKFVLVANRHPKFLDDSGALAMRELPIMFTRSFMGDEQRDNTLGDKLTAELPGIANWALEGLARLRAAGRFTESEALRMARDVIEHQQSHMSAFAKYCLRYEVGATTSKGAMYDAYEAWHSYARIRSTEVRDRESFKADLLAACSRHGVKLAQVKVNGKNAGERWRGVAIRENAIRKFRGDEFSDR